MNPTPCPFCDKLAHLAELPDAERVGQFPSFFVLLGRWQFYHGYCILVARTHARELHHLPEPERLAYFNDLCRLAKAVEQCFSPTKLNYELLGNQEPHLHWHLFPRYREDPDRHQPVWLALDRAERDPATKRRLRTGPASPADTAARLRNLLRAHADFRAMTAPLRIGTRGSPLALWQANHVAGLLRPLAAPRPVELVLIQTEGDRDATTSLAHIGGHGVFTKEIQRALLDGRVDIAVHSLKDLPTFPVEGLALGAVPVRGPTGDVLVSPAGKHFDDLPRGAKVATGSLRRRAQVKHRRPDVELVDIRGNVETRLRKLSEHGYAGLILARAGLDRLGLAVAAEELDPAWMLPAVGQGALGLECRAADTPTLTLLAPLNDPATHHAVTAERALLYFLGGGCQVPIGAAAVVVDSHLTLRGAVLAPDGSRRIEGTLDGPAADAEAIGRRLAERLNADGADGLLRLAR